MEIIYTLEEVSRYLKVPVEALRKEIASGRLCAMNIGGFIRIGEFALADYKNLASKNASLEDSLSAEEEPQIDLQRGEDFVHTWPDGKSELFQNVYEGIAKYAGREHQIRLGFTVRKSAGRARSRSLVMVDRYPTVEFVKADDRAEPGMMASIIKDRLGKQLPANTNPPDEYKSVSVGGYREVVVGPGAPNGLAVICNSGDLGTMIKHALIRFKYRAERA